MTIEEQIKKNFVEALNLNIGWETLQDDLDLLIHFNVDSVTVLEFLVGIEEDFGIEIKDEELSIELLRSVKTLSSFIRQKSEKSA
ncbi:acyl carrier protein [Paenibacillus xylanexedens]|uniref:acyl carrier protein n=1 Tax=Paenibacillus xylanexedens TaxID=528191 RepID=UPI003D019066